MALRARTIVRTGLMVLLASGAALAQESRPAKPTALDQGKAAMRAREFDKATGWFERAMAEDDKKSDEAAYLKALSLYYAEKHAAAVTAADVVLEKFPNSSWRQKGAFVKAAALAGQRKFQEAEAVYSDQANRLLSGTRKQKIASVVLEFADALANKPDPKDVGAPPADPARAANLYRKVLAMEIDRALKDEVMLKVARADQEAGQFAQAIEDYRAYLTEFDPDWMGDVGTPTRMAGQKRTNPPAAGKNAWPARYRLAECQLLAGDNRSARTNAEDLLGMMGAMPSTRPNGERLALGDSARWLVVKSYRLPNPSGEELEQAVKSAREFAQGLAFDPRGVIAAWWVAQAYQAHGRADQAVAAYEEFIAGKGYKMPEGEAATKKIEEVGKSPAALKDEWEKTALYCIGQIRFEQRKYDEAMKAWSSYTHKYPNGPQWAASYQGIIEAEYGAAVAALADKKHEEARTLFEAFLAKHPLDGRARQILFTFGQVDYADAQKEEEKADKADKAAVAAAYKRAIDQWARLISQHRGSEEASLALYRIGQIYEEKLGDLDKALESYRELTWGSQAGSARARIALMTQKSLTVRTDRKFRTNEPAKIRLNVRNIEKLTFKQYNLDLEAYFRKTHAIGSVDALDIDLIQPDKTWDVKIDGYAKYKPIEQTVEVPFGDGKAGVCIVNVSEEDLEGTTLVLRSDLDMIVKSSRKESLVFVQNMLRETPAAGVELLLSDGQKVIHRGKTGPDGVYRVVLDELKSVETLRVFAWAGASVASDGLELSGLGLARGVSARGYIYTDRSAYQPGQTVKFRGIIRDAKDGGYTCPAGESYLVTVADSQGRQLSQKTLTLSAFGTFNGELALDVQSPVGAYTITASAKDKPEKSYSSQFLVQQFKTEKMRLTLETDRAVYFRGESVKLSIAADYYWGQPVAGKSVRYTLPDGRQLTATTDAAGKVAVTFDTTGLQPGSPLRFAAELEGENVRAAHVAVLARLGLALAVKPSRDLVLAEEGVDVDVAATTPDGKPAGGQAVKLFVLQRQAPAADPVFAGLPWLARPAPQAAEATVEEHALTTDKETGKATVKLSLKKGGQYILRATAEDRFKQVVTGESGVSVSDDEDATKLRFFADSDTLQVGGKALVKLHSRVEAKLALLTFEGETILSHKVVAIKKDYNPIDVTVGHEHFPNFQIAVAVMDGRALRTAAKPFTVQRQLNVKVRPLQEAYAPGAAGKAELTVTDQLGKPVKGELSLAVVDEAVFAAFPDGTPKILDFFQAGVKRQAEFRLASTCSFAYAAPTRKVLQAYKDEKDRLALREEEQRKLAELGDMNAEAGGFVMQDALRPPAPAMPVVAHGVMNAAAKGPASARDGGRGGAAPGEDVMLGKEMAGGDRPDGSARMRDGKATGLASEIAAPARREMPEAGLWMPAVVTDADGKAVVELAMPETTTRWRLTARGCTVETLVGEAAGAVVTRKDFFVAVKAPASWQEGDKVRLLARVHNMTKYAGPVEVTLTIWGGEGFKNRLVEKSDTVKIDADGTAELLLPEVDVPLAAGLKAEVRAKGGQAADAVAVEVPVRPWGLEFAADAGGVSKDSAVVEVQLPAGRKYGSKWMAVSIGADLQRTVLDLAAGGGYPVPLARGCAILPPPEEAAHPGGELLAAVTGLRYAKALKAPAADMQRLADRANGLIATLVVSQQADGGWCWRGRAGADWAVTATCFWALVEARGEALPVNAQTIAGAREYLRNTFTRLGAGENDPKAVILHALSTDNAADFAHANRLHRERNALSGPALAYTAMACVNLKRPELAKELLDVLEQKGHKAPGAANGLQWDGAAAYSYLNDDIETTALAALAMMKVRPGSPKVKDAVDFLLSRRGCGGFTPAKARGPAVAAIAEYFRAGADARADYRLVVLVNGKELKTIEARGGQDTLLLAVPGESIVEGANRVEFRLDGRGQFAYAVTLRGFSTDMTEPGGWNYPRVQSRTYRHANLEYRGRPIAAESSSPVSHVEVGQHVKVNVTMEYWGGEHAYVAVEEPLPAGMVLVEGSLQGRFIHHDVRDGRIVMYFPPGGTIGNYAYELVGYSTGQYRVGPTVIRDVLHPGRMRVAAAAALAVLRPGEKSDDKYEMNREERFALGQLYFNDGQYKDALAHLEPLLDRKQPYNEREVARMLLWIYTAEGFYDARKIVDVFEVLRERYTDLEIPFEKILTIGKAYHDMGEFERAYLVFRATIDASFVKDANVSAVLEEEGQFLGSLDYQEDLWREYPDTPEVAQAYFALSQVLYQKAPEAAQLAKQAIRNARAKGRAAPGRLPNRVDMLKEAIVLLREFMTLYPTNPLADDAAFSMANAYLDLKQYQAVVDLCTGFKTLFPKSEFEGGFQYMTALGHFWQRRSEEALAAAKVVAEGQGKDRDFARYIVAQIYHAEGKPAEAIDWYRKVAEQYPDAKGAVEYFEAKSIGLEEVSVVRPGEPVKLTIKYRNVKEAGYQIYRVDLMKLYLREKNLSTITKVNLAGIAPLAEATVALGDGKDYADKEKTVELKVTDEGAYLVICRGDDLFASGLVLITPLKIDMQEDAVSGRVRVNVTDTVTKRYVPEVYVKAVGSAEAAFRGGQTDLRGIFVADGIRGQVTVIARSGESRYAFFRGQTWLGAPKEQLREATPAIQRVDTDYNLNLRSKNDAVQRANTVQYQQFRQAKPAGVNLEKLK